jgi:hypothetical protein
VPLPLVSCMMILSFPLFPRSQPTHRPVQPDSLLPYDMPCRGMPPHRSVPLPPNVSAPYASMVKYLHILSH